MEKQGEKYDRYSYEELHRQKKYDRHCLILS